ncbi:MAG: hypothetical protein FI687_01635 [SAR202 cluster bacterium]|nr:hypothetical protein [Chloroflexota bacterium]MQG18466.1 hypothetical protein [SAR202 cluster bacterium]
MKNKRLNSFLDLEFLRFQNGISLLELAVTLAIVAVISVPLIGIISQIFSSPLQWNAEMTATNNSSQVVQLITDDALQAQNITILDKPDYVTLEWVNHSTFPSITYKVTYSYDEDSKSIKRIEKINDDQASTSLYGSIDLYEDVVIEKKGSLVKVTATSSVDGIFENAKSTSFRSSLARVLVDDEPPLPSNYLIAWDDFETKNFIGGDGWKNDWVVNGNGSASIIEDSGTHVIKIFRAENAQISSIERKLKLSDHSNPKLQAVIKFENFDSGDLVNVQVGPSGGSFTTLTTFSKGSDVGSYQSFVWSLPSISFGDEATVRIQVYTPNIGTSKIGVLIDQVEVVSEWSND